MLKMLTIGQQWWHKPIIPAIREAEAGGRVQAQGQSG